MVKLIGKYTIPMDAMGYYHNYINHTLHPGRLTWNISSSRFGLDHFPFFSWVMAVGSSRLSSRV